MEVDWIRNDKSASVAGFSSLLDWLQADAIVDSIPDSLLATKVALRRLDAHVTEQKLYLLKFASCLMAQAGTGPAVMPHAALEALCRIPDYAESMARPPIWRAVSEIARESDSA